jgi:excisionase family DNA binding protein
MNGLMKELLRPSDLCPQLGLSSGRVYQLIADGVIPHVRVGNAIRIPRQAWLAWLEAQNRQAEASCAVKSGSPQGGIEEMAATRIKPAS